MIKFFKKVGSLFFVAIILANHAQALLLVGLSTDPFIGMRPGDEACYVDLAKKDLDMMNHSISALSFRSRKFVAESKKDMFIQKHSVQLHQIAHTRLCSFKAAQLGITKLPAIVFDNKYVIYGYTDANQARRIFQHYSEENN